MSNSTESSTDPENRKLRAKVEQLEFKQKVFATVGAGALILNSVLTWFGVIQPIQSFRTNNPSEVVTLVDKSAETHEKEKEREVLDKLTEAMVKINETLERQKPVPTPVPTPTPIVRSR